MMQLSSDKIPKVRVSIFPAWKNSQEIFMRKTLLVFVTMLSLTWGIAAQQPSGGTFVLQQIGSTNYVSPRFQIRHSSQRFNPPLIFDIGGTSSTENIFQVIPLTTANKTTFQVIPMAQATTIVFHDPGGATGTVATYEDASPGVWVNPQTFQSTMTLNSTSIFTLQRTNTQMAIGAAGHLDTITFAAPASAAITLTFPDPGGNASIFYANATTAQNLLANAFQIADGTDSTKQLKFGLSGGTTAIATTMNFGPTSARTVTWPDASITVPGAVFTDCGNNTTCSPTTISSTVKIVKGICTASSATTCTVASMPAFTSSSSYVCNVTDGTTAANNALKITYVSSSSFTITTTSSSDAFSYSCIGT